jgi:hypothetical protein
MMPFNLRRGLLRLWVLASLLWCAGMTIKAFDDFRHDKTPIDALPALYPVQCEYRRGIEPKDFEQKEGRCWYSPSSFRRLYPEYADIEDHALAEALYKKAGLSVPRTEVPLQSLILNRIQFVLFYGVGVSLAMLLFGRLILWAVSGFASSE